MNTPGILVRPMLPEEQEEARRVMGEGLATLRATYRPTAATVSHSRRLDQRLVRLVAVSEGLIVGVVRYWTEEDALSFIALATAHAHRGRGVARALIEAMRDIARQAGLARVAAKTIRETGNVPIFERLGFRVVHEVVTDGYVSDRYPVLHDVSLESAV